MASGLVTALFVGGYWLALWYRSVRWNSFRITASLGTVVAALTVGVATGVLMGRIDYDLGAFLFGPATVFSWLAMTVFVWRETGAERADRVAASAPGGIVCPACGYNLTGLRQCTCPECGASFTIDELLASQPGREGGEIERVAGAKRSVPQTVVKA